jgi:ribosomal peptide maturation radical SAM protein 1
VVERILFVYPPFGAASFPSIGLSILKSVLIRAEIPADIRYLNLEFIDRLPGTPNERVRLFDTISQRNASSLGDWVFSESLFGPQTAGPMDGALRGILADSGGKSGLAEKLFAARSVAGSFLDDIMEQIRWRDYPIVGFHSIFNQTIACLAIAKRLKNAHPSIITLLGGPAVQDEIGAELLRQFPQIDYVIQGEADRTIVPIIRQLLKGETITSIAGVIHRRRMSTGFPGEVVSNSTDTVSDMDSIPVPDFDDYFATLRKREFERELEVYLPIENARGCWWGAKHHCVFCGMVGQTMVFRSKSPERVLNEIRELITRYGNRNFICVDSVLDMHYFETLLPRLAEARLDIHMFYEVKANLTRSQVYLLDDAGVHFVQPGLEHLSTQVLKLMRKGTSYLQNVQFLKWAQERSMIVFWSILYGFPGESWADYASLPERIASLYHLFPPKALVRVRADRFSPLHFAARELGLSRLYPAEGYHYVYPFSEESLSRLAYYFEYEYADREAELNQRIESGLDGSIREWNERFFRRRASLNMFEGPECLLILDTRYDRPVYYVMSGIGRRVYLECNTARSRGHLQSMLTEWRRQSGPALLDLLFDTRELAICSIVQAAEAAGIQAMRYPEVSTETELDWLLDCMIRDRLATSEADRYLALACSVNTPLLVASPPSWGSDGEAMSNVAGTRNIRLEGVEGLFGEAPLPRG